MAGVLGSAPSQQGQLLPVLLSFASDPVPNLRFNLAKALERLLPSIADPATTVASLVRPVLTSLTGDKDEDVRFYARKALAACPGEAGAVSSAAGAGASAGDSPSLA